VGGIGFAEGGDRIGLEVGSGGQPLRGAPVKAVLSTTVELFTITKQFKLKQL